MAGRWPTRGQSNGMQLRERGNEDGKYEEPSTDEDFERRHTPKKTRSYRAPQLRKHLAATFLFQSKEASSVLLLKKFMPFADSSI